MIAVRLVCPCSRKRYWGWSELTAIVEAVAVSDFSLDSLTVWAVGNGYSASVFVASDGTAEVTLHRDCCGYDPRKPRRWRMPPDAAVRVLNRLVQEYHARMEQERVERERDDRAG